MTLQSQKPCTQCGTMTLHCQDCFSDGTGCLLTVLTGGLFLPLWIVMKIVEGLTAKWRCQRCGETRRF